MTGCTERPAAQAESAAQSASATDARAVSADAARGGGADADADAASGPLFLELDLDENGRITQEEAQAVPLLRENFSIFDVDGSDNIDEEEYAAALEEDFTPKN
jgi:hypothetical protein